MGTPTAFHAHASSESGVVFRIPRWRSDDCHDGADTTTDYACSIPTETTAQLRALADRLDVPIDSLLLAAHAKVLALLTGERSLLTGYVAPGSGDGPAPCALQVGDGAWSALALHAQRAARGATLSEATATVLAAEPTYEVVLDLSGLAGHTTAASHRQAGAEQPAQPMLSETVVLRISFVGVPDGMRLCVRGRGDVLDIAYARRIAGYLLTSLKCMAADGSAEHQHQSLLSSEELAQQLDGMAGPHRDLPDRRMHELFEEKVREHPHRIAAVHDGTEWTYDKLNQRANRIAHALLARGLAAEDVVAVVTERNLEWMAAVLAVFKAGGVYLPVEPHFPDQRIAAMLTRSNCRFVLTEFGSASRLPEPSSSPEPHRLLIADLLAEGGEGDAAPAYQESNPDVPVGAGQLAYIYFTSGSTGEPKGAMCEHAGMLNHLLAKIEDLELGPGQTVAQTAPQCFDISLWQLVSGLLVGARTLIIGQKEILDVRRYIDTVVEGGVEVLQVVPSYLEVILTHLEEQPRDLGRLRVVSATGEALKKELVERWFTAFPGIKLMNAYGLTETSDDTNHEVMDRVPDLERIPLGSVIRNVHVYVVDEQLQPVPLGAPGEIVFSGVCVGRGYINDPERTAAAFGTDPHRPGRRLYRSGDIGRWLPQGTLEFLGRRDAQTKIRGFRIEIGEIENHLLRVPGVRDSCVVVLEGPDGEKHLVAFYAGEAALDPAGLREFLGDALPPYMVPRVFHHRSALPLTGNGKIDKKALVRDAGETAVTGPTAPSGTADGMPRTATEKHLAALWAQVLGLPIGEMTRNRHFFDAGGTSLSAVRLGAATGGSLALAEIVRHPVLAELAEAMDQKSQQGAEDGGTTQSHTSRAFVPAAPGTVAAHGAERHASDELGLELNPGKPPILRITEAMAGNRLRAWTDEHRSALEAALLTHGAVLIRGLGVHDAGVLAQVAESMSGAIVPEVEAFARRRPLGGPVVSSLEWPPDQAMCMHHELSYGLEFPRLLTIGCFTPPADGGITGLADAQAVLSAMPRAIVERFTELGWSLTRSYNDLVGVPWPESLGAADRAAAEAYCRANATDFAWQEDGGLRTVQRRSAVITHPLTGRRVWFNQIAFLNEWTMEPAIRDYLVAQFGSDGLPFNTSYGDGSPIDADTVRAINEVYEKATLREPWHAGDVLLVDNIRMAHSREPYSGRREIGMVLGTPVRLTDCSPTL
ncbi:amino acid adenylation domain-containing protein [Streptomyces sp. NPDC005706]|uniref:non-ribosomal peptide synthetase n=1 Tax=Streptomyces sp. NPDC005706 TaxID=3157169 RepID=UPI0033EBF40A